MTIGEYANSRRRPKEMFAVLLACGHKRSVAISPWHRHTTYPCPMNTGCGYSQGWVSYPQGDMLVTNKLYRKGEAEDE